VHSAQRKVEQSAKLAALLRRKKEIEDEVEERMRRLQVAQKSQCKALLAVLAGRMNELEEN
jgi:hypothetical protein